MGNPSVAYEVLIYLNSFYFGMFACCELGMGLLKAINLPYTKRKLAQDSVILVAVCIVEPVRIQLGRTGTLADRGWHCLVSVFLTVPLFFGVTYILTEQCYILTLEYLMCTLQLALYLVEIFYAIMFGFSIRRPVTYD